MMDLDAQAYRKLQGKRDQLSFLRTKDPMVILDDVSEGIFSHNSM